MSELEGFIPDSNYGYRYSVKYYSTSNAHDYSVDGDDSKVPVAEQLFTLKVTDDAGTLSATLSYESTIYHANGVPFVDAKTTASIHSVVPDSESHKTLL